MYNFAKKSCVSKSNKHIHAMKKTLLLTAVLALGMTVMAQTPVKSNLDAQSTLKKIERINQQNREVRDFTTSLDSIVNISDWDNFSNAYQYDMQGRTTVVTSYSEYGNERQINIYDGALLSPVECWSAEYGCEWEHYADELYTYDDNDNLILFEYNALNFGEWGITDRYEYEYDEQNRLTQEVTWWYNFYSENPQLELSSMATYSYGTNSVTIESYSYSTETEEWLPASCIVDNFSPYGDVATEIQMNWDDGLQCWVEYAKVEYDHDAEGHITTVTMYYLPEGEWEIESQFVAEYNELGQLVATTNSDIWMTGELSPYTHDEYEYDANGNRSILRGYYYEGDEMIENVVRECLYDDEASENIMGCQEVWDNMVGCYYTCAADWFDVLINNKWTLFASVEYGGEYVSTVEPYYSAVTGVDENGNDVKAKIHGTVGKVVVSCDTPIAVSVYDMAGRQVAVRSRVSDCEISLTAGIYVVRAGDAAVKVVVR